MAIFGKKENNNKTADIAPVISTKPVVMHTTVKKHPGHILLSPRVTEKGTIVSMHDAYVFNVAPSANKREIAHAVEETFKVTVRSVRTTTVRGKNVITRNTGRIGRTAGGKKAYVFLKKGDKIEVI